MKDKKALFLIAGHSIYNPGAEYKGIEEREKVQIIAENLSKKYYGDDIKVFTIGINEDVSLDDKIKKVNFICNEYGYNVENSILIEIHCNAGKGTGIETLGYKGYKDFEELGNIINENLYESTGLKNRGNKEGKQFKIINSTIPLALIVENGFIDTQKDREVLINDINSFSDGIYNGLKEYIGFDDEKIDYEKLYKELKKENNALKEKLKKINLLSE